MLLKSNDMMNLLCSIFFSVATAEKNATVHVIAIRWDNYNYITLYRSLIFEDSSVAINYSQSSQKETYLSFINDYKFRHNCYNLCQSITGQLNGNSHLDKRNRSDQV